MTLQDFSGGRNTRVAPSLLQPNQAQIYQNIDNELGSLSPIKGHTLHTDTVERYFKWYNAHSEFVSKATETTFLEYKDIMYMTQEDSYPLKYDGTIESRLGIVGPELPITLGVEAAGNLTGTYIYAYTYYDSTTGLESQPNELSEEIVVTNQSIYIHSFVASLDPQVDRLRLYRIGGDLSDFVLVVEQEGYGDYVDDLPDIDIAGNHQLDSYENKEAPVGLKYLFEAYSILFGALEDKLYYSNIAEPNSWPEVNFIDFESSITGIASIQSGLIVFTRFKAYLVTGSSPPSFSRTILDGEQGCLSHHTIQFTKNNLIWLSLDGICTTTGGLIELVSMPLIGKPTLELLESVSNAQVSGRVYYLAHSTGIIAFDFRYNLIVRDISTEVLWLDAHDGSLYSNIGGAVYSMFNSEPLAYKYRSPILTEGSYSNLKLYKDFYIRYTGQLELKVFLDGVLKNSKSLDGDECYNLKALASSSGYGLELELEGTATVHEINYKVEARQNGR